MLKYTESIINTFGILFKFTLPFKFILLFKYILPWICYTIRYTTFIIRYSTFVIQYVFSLQYCSGGVTFYTSIYPFKDFTHTPMLVL